MTVGDVLAASWVPDTKSVYFLGCFDKRVTLYSQQVRALNLAAAILETPDVLRGDGRVAIVGAGAAGLTAAVAFAKTLPNLQTIDVYEAHGEALYFQQTSGRFLHPHNYDWPAGDPTITDAGLPVLNWRAGPAREVQAHLVAQFDEVAKTTPIRLLTNSKVERVIPFPLGGARVEIKGWSGRHPDYDVVILAVGFGLERSISEWTPSYWRSAGLDEGFLLPTPPLIFVSGNGDGGLVDFMTAAFNALTHPQICEFLMNLDWGPALAAVDVVEQAAWADPAMDIHLAYNADVIPLIPPPVFLAVQDRLRTDVHVILHTNEPRLFKRETAILNRLGSAVLLAADRQSGRNALEAIVGTQFGADPSTPNQAVQLVGRAPLQPYKRLLRHGPDSDGNLKPFVDLVAAMPLSALTHPTGLRPATPQLIAEAVARFGHLAAPAGPVADGNQVPEAMLRAPTRGLCEGALL